MVAGLKGADRRLHRLIEEVRVGGVVTGQLAGDRQPCAQGLDAVVPHARLQAPADRHRLPAAAAGNFPVPAQRFLQAGVGGVGGLQFVQRLAYGGTAQRAQEGVDERGPGRGRVEVEPFFDLARVDLAVALVLGEQHERVGEQQVVFELLRPGGRRFQLVRVAADGLQVVVVGDEPLLGAAGDGGEQLGDVAMVNPQRLELVLAVEVEQQPGRVDGLAADFPLLAEVELLEPLLDEQRHRFFRGRGRGDEQQEDSEDNPSRQGDGDSGGTAWHHDVLRRVWAAWGRWGKRCCFRGTE